MYGLENMRVRRGGPKLGVSDNARDRTMRGVCWLSEGR